MEKQDEHIEEITLAFGTRKLAKVHVRRGFFFIVLSLIGIVLLPTPVWAQQERSRDKGVTIERQDTRLPLEAVPQLTPQQVPCDGNNHTTNAFNNSWLMGGPMVGFAWTPNATATITRVEVFTGESTANVALAIWSDDGGSPSKPLANLGDTGYFPLPTQVNSWQGADLLAPVTVNASTKYWIVFDPNGGEQAPIQNGTGQQYWGSSTGTITGASPSSWSGPFSFSDHAWKFRVYCLQQKDVYAVKFLCGSFLPKSPTPPVDGVEWPVKPGNYFTAINVHNPNWGSISFQKKAVMLYRADKPPKPEEPMPPGKLFEASVREDWGLEIDCSDIRNVLLSGTAPGAPSFIKGWVVIEVMGTPKNPEPRPIDVTAVYTSHGWNQSTKTPTYEGFAEDVEPIRPTRVKQ